MLLGRCGLPPLVPNAGWRSVKGSERAPIIVRYKCINGYSLKGSPSIECIDGMWNSTAPSCLRTHCQHIVDQRVEDVACPHWFQYSENSPFLSVSSHSIATWAMEHGNLILTL